MSNNKQHSPFYNVLRRELQRMVSRRLYFGVCIVLPLFCIFFMSTIFGNGQMENIPVGIVDQDQSALSRELTRQVEAVPTFRVTHHYADAETARKATQAKEIYGYLVIPNRFEEDVTGGRQATLSYYYHYALLSVGGEVRGAFESLLRTFSMAPIVVQATAMGISQKEVSTFLVPIRAQNHPLFNPDLDYSVYLSNPFFFIFFQVLILLTTVYAVGSEIKFRTGDDWLATAKMNMVTALFGKLLPYTIIFSLMSILANYVMFGLMNIPFFLWILAVEPDLCPVRDRIPGSGGVPFLPFSGNQHHYQYRVDGRFAGGDLVGCYVSGSGHVCAGLLYFFPVSGTSFRGDQSEPVVRRLWVCLYLVELQRVVLFYIGCVSDGTAFKKCNIKS